MAIPEPGAEKHLFSVRLSVAAMDCYRIYMQNVLYWEHRKLSIYIENQIENIASGFKIIQLYLMRSKILLRI